MNNFNVCEFKSHSDSDRTLIEHLLGVGFKTEWLIKNVIKKKENLYFLDSDIAFLTGLFHDAGKINPYYQKMFLVIKNNNNEYIKAHAIFSSIIALDLIDRNKFKVKNKDELKEWELKDGKYKAILYCIYGHHTKISIDLPERIRSFINSVDKIKANVTCNSVDSNLNIFINCLYEKLKIFDPNKLECLIQNLDNNIDEKVQIKDFFSSADNQQSFINRLNLPKRVLNLPDKENYIIYFELNLLYSALLQADRGTFSKSKEKTVINNYNLNYPNWEFPKFSININTEGLISKSKKDDVNSLDNKSSNNNSNNLNKLRSNIQESIMSNLSENIDLINEGPIIINAPTGSGKTKLFLDIINKIKNNSKYNKINRVIYFSPFLALADDFISKITDNNVINKGDKKKILKYNYLSKELISEENEELDISEHKAFDFEQESFNIEMIITTMERLLLTLFSNSTKNKMKFLSLTNSILIIDEIQTIPFELLNSTFKLLTLLIKNTDSKVILVSATVPKPLLENGSKFLMKPNEEETKEYLRLTNKNISLIEADLDINNFKFETDKRVLVIFNTRKRSYKFAKDLLDKNNKINYISTGIRYKDRKLIIDKLKNVNYVGLTISTQVLEAGIDISFDYIYRQIAPFDSIIQAMGRLNRNAENNSSKLYIFNIEDIKSGYYLPYEKLEVDQTKYIINNLKNKGELTSLNLISKVDNYYNEYLNKNINLINKQSEIDSEIKNLKFDQIEKVLKDFNMDQVSIIIPDSGELEKVLEEFKFDYKRENINKYKYEYSANIPKSHLERIKDLLDKDLYKRNILIPKDEKSLRDIYDSTFGLDKWVDDKEEY